MVKMHYSQCIGIMNENMLDKEKDWKGMWEKGEKRINT
jgi:hypothetical protein